MEPFKSVYFGVVRTTSESTIIRLIERNETNCPICYIPLQGVKNFEPPIVAPSVQMPAHLGNGKPMPRISRMSDGREERNWHREPLTTHCGHTFCKACIINWMAACYHEEPKKLATPCPICRTEVIKTKTYHYRFSVRLALSFFNKAIASQRRPFCAWEKIEELRETKEDGIITPEDRHHRYTPFDRARFRFVSGVAMISIYHLREVLHDFDDQTFCHIALNELLTAWICIYPKVLDWVEATLVRPCPFEPERSLVRMDALINIIKSCMAISLFRKNLEDIRGFSADDCKLMSEREYQEFAHSLQQKKVWGDLVIFFQVTIGLLKGRDEQKWAEITDAMYEQIFETSYPEA